MMSPHVMLTFIAAVTVLMLIPGPNVALITANSVARGWRYGLLTVAGTASAMVMQLSLTGLGLSAALGLAGQFFGVLRWIGALYLIWLGVQSWRAPAAETDTPADASEIFWRGMIVSFTNPKTLFFYAAFFPQFLTPGPGIAAQIVTLAVLFILVAVIIDSGWALLAHVAREHLLRHGRLKERISGTILMGMGVGLAVARLR